MLVRPVCVTCLSRPRSNRHASSLSMSSTPLVVNAAPNSATLSSSNVLGMSGVQMGPGATPLTRMPVWRWASWVASERVKTTFAPLVAL